MKTLNAIFIMLTVMILTVLATSCSGLSSGQSPIEPAMIDDFFVSDYSPDSVMTASILGAYELTIDAESMSVELTLSRESAIGESWTVSGLSYFTVRPCEKCFKVDGIKYENGRIILQFHVQHPFEKGDPEESPSGRNRHDLDIFDLALVVAPKPFSTIDYPLLDAEVPAYLIENSDGYTIELADLIGSSVALPYVLVIDDSASNPPSNTYNRFEMGSSADFDVVFPLMTGNPGQAISFDLYLTFGYGSSAVLIDRFDPKYYNPEFNRKAAWKVKVTPPNGSNTPQLGNTWDNTDNSTEYDVTIKVYDWQIGANVNPDLDELSDIYASSNVDMVSLEISGMTNAAKTVAGNAHAPGGTGMPNSPLEYTISIANENLLQAGDYIGLVAVYDERSPGSYTAGRDHLYHTPDGGQNLNDHDIPAYITYQTFTATVVAGPCGPITGSIISPSCPVTNLVNESTVNFTVSASSAQGGNPIVLYEADYNFDSITFNATASNTNGIFNNAGPFTVPAPCPNNIPYSFQVAFRATDSCQPPNVTIFAVCTVVVERCDTQCGPISGNIISPTCPVTGLDDGATVDFTVSATSGGLGTRIIIYEVDHDYDGVTFNPANTSLTGVFNDVGPFVTPDPCYAQVPYDFTVAFRATDNCDPPNQTIFATCTVTVEDCNTDGNLIWAKRAGGTSEDKSRGITALSDNSIVVSGEFYGTATFGQGEPNETNLTSDGLSDMFIACYDPDGSLLWAKHAGGSSYDSCMGITTLSDNSIVATGYFRGTAIFGRGEPNETTLTSAGDNDIFIARYSLDGTLAWVKRAGGANNDVAYKITAFPDNSTVITGFISGTATFGLGEPNQTILTSAGDWDMFVARYNQNGTLLWAKRAGGTGIDQGYEITALSDNSTVVTGGFQGTATFGPGEVTETFLTSAGDRDMFIACYNQNGALLWAKRAGGSGGDFGQGISSLSDDSTVVTGYFLGTATFGEGDPNQTILTSAGGYDIFIARYNSDGALIWAKRAGGTSGDIGNGITTLSDNSVVVTGEFRDTATFGEGEVNETVLISAGNLDMFVARYNTNGTLLWAKHSGGSSREHGLAITTLSDNSTVVTGWFEDTATFGPGEQNETDLASAGSYDIFIARLEP